jgi:glycosyltransferase involved in cell wall biosynthesis
MTGKKHILIMAHNMNLGGTEKALLAFIHALEEKYVNITLLLLEKKGALFNEIPNWVNIEIIPDFDAIKPIIYDPPILLIKSNIKKMQLLGAFKNGLRYLIVKITKRWYYNYIAALKRHKKRYQADIAIAYAGPSDFITYYMHKQVDAQEKYQWIHFDVSKVIFNTNFGNKYYPYFDKIYCVSENAKKVFDTMFPQFINKTKVFKNIVSKNLLENAALIGDTFTDGFDGIRILTLGRLSEEKGQQMIPNIVKQLKDENLDFRWYLIGDGQLTTEINNQIKDLEIEDHLVLLGSKINPYRYVKECDIYVQTSFHEGYCLTVHEAKIFNKPVVVTNVASASNLIVDNEDGLIVPINEIGLFNGVKQLLTNSELRRGFQKNILALETINEINKLGL